MGPICTLPPSNKYLCGIVPDRKILLYLLLSFLAICIIGFTLRHIFSETTPTTPIEAPSGKGGNLRGSNLVIESDECNEQCRAVCAESCAHDGSLALFNRALSMV